MQHIVVWSLVVASSLCLVNGCSMPSGWHPLTDEEHVLGSQAFIYGRVLRTFRRPGELTGRTYTAEVRVYCTFKGPRMPEKVNFTRVGVTPGLCYSTELLPGRTYAILLDWLPDEGQSLSPHLTLSADDAKIQRLVRTCGLYAQYPEGFDESEATWTCPVAAPSDVCLDQAYFDSQRVSSKPRGDGGARGGGRTSSSGSRYRRPPAPVARKQQRRSFWNE